MAFRLLASNYRESPAISFFFPPKTNVARLARLEAHRRSRRNIEAIAKRSASIEGERRVRFGEMILTANLNRSVACVGNSKRDGRPILVQDDLAGCWKNLARYNTEVRPCRELEVFRYAAPPCRISSPRVNNAGITRPGLTTLPLICDPIRSCVRSK